MREKQKKLFNYVRLVGKYLLQIHSTTLQANNEMK